MVAYLRIRLTNAVPPIGGLIAAIVVALVFVLLPQDMLEDWTWNSGVAALIPVAQPPLGTTARAILAFGFGAVAGAVVWSSLYLLFGPGGFLAPRAPTADGVPVLRRADSHPDAPARRPISAAADLGDPDLAPLSPPTRDLPADLDQPLAAYDPHAILPAPREPVRPVTALNGKPVAPRETSPVMTAPSVDSPAAPSPAAPQSVIATVMPQSPEPVMPLRIEPDHRRESIADGPVAPLPVPSAPAAGAPLPRPVEDDAPPSIEVLLARLERGARRRPDSPRPTVDDAIGALRGLSH